MAKVSQTIHLTGVDLRGVPAKGGPWQKITILWQKEKQSHENVLLNLDRYLKDR